ncbi:MAG: radical SAM protein [Planctomycetes bacterium]|nr:radical SAM protein [Planctomycetota bacterium]
MRKLKEFLLYYKQTGLILVIKRLLKRFYSFINSRYPAVIFIEPTSRCNLKCPICWVQQTKIQRKKDLMSLDEFKKIINDIKGFCGGIILGFTGEPMLNKEIYSMIKYAVQNGLITSMITNATLLGQGGVIDLLDSELHDLFLSIDGATKETYEHLRQGAKFDNVVNDVRNLMQIKKKRGQYYPRVHMQMVVTKTNVHEISSYKQLAERLGVDRAYVKTLHIEQRGDEKYVNTILNEYFIEGDHARYQLDKTGKLELKTEFHFCPKWENPVITCDGQIVLCCFDIEGQYSFGNIFQEDFKMIWNKQKNKVIRQQAKKRSLSICQNCLPAQKNISEELFSNL